MKVVKVFFIFLIFNALPSHGIELGEFSLSITPGGVVPLGDSTSYFKMGGGAGIAGDFSIIPMPLIFVRTEAEYERPLHIC